MSSASTPLAAIFDVGGVLIDVRMEDAPRYWAGLTGADPDELISALLADAEHRRLQRGEMSIQQYHAHVAELTGLPLSFDEFLKGWTGVFHGPMPGIEPLLPELARRLRLVALTNTDACHAGIWPGLYAGIVSFFERIFMSHEIGVRKPEPESYRRALDYLGLQPDRVAFVDDDAVNVEAAAALGMRGILANDTAAVAEQFRQMGVGLSPL